MHIIGREYSLTEELFLDVMYNNSASGNWRKRMKMSNRYNTPEYNKGRATEQLVRDLLLGCFDGVKDVYLAPTGSKADDDLKIDLVVETDGGHLFGYQVKSSLNGAHMHLQKDTDVPVMWLDITERKHRLSFVKDVEAYMMKYIRWKPSVLAVWQTRRSLVERGVWNLPTKVATTTFGVEGMRMLLLLGLAVEKKDTFVFGNPPTK
ncbi:hypothetical protein OsccyDRAFT_0661 [Leptolyngbyaceae cyanobacterium JSC-12]|nr:hypothetical protein OsccyDRAFT_0661 [Leptolyngbyaceae cyanobacterium JSC-12]